MQSPSLSLMSFTSSGTPGLHGAPIQAPSLSPMPLQPIFACSQARLNMTPQVATPHQGPPRQQAILGYTSGCDSSGTPGLHEAPMQAPSRSLMPVQLYMWLSDSTGCDTTSCDTTPLAIKAASCTLGCASSYTSRGTPGVTCGTNVGTFTISMPGQPIPTRCQAQRDMTRQVATPHQWPSQQQAVRCAAIGQVPHPVR